MEQKTSPALKAEMVQQLLESIKKVEVIRGRIGVKNETIKRLEGISENVSKAVDFSDCTGYARRVGCNHTDVERFMKSGIQQQIESIKEDLEGDYLDLKHLFRLC